MGIPLSALRYLNTDLFDIIGKDGDIEWATTLCTFFTPPSKDLIAMYKAQDSTFRVQNPYLLLDDGKPKCPYGRIFIRRKEVVK